MATVNPDKLKIDIQTLPSNSHRERESKTIEKKVQPVVSVKPRVKPETFMDKFKNSFFASDIGSIKDYLIFDVLIPTLKNTFEDAVMNTIHMSLFGENNRRNNIRRNGGSSIVNYNSIYDLRNRQSSSAYNQISPTDRARHNFSNIIVSSRGEAEDVLSSMVDLISEYGAVSVASFYSLLGLEQYPIDHKWGWTDISSAEVLRVRDGYSFRLPRPDSI